MQLTNKALPKKELGCVQCQNLSLTIFCIFSQDATLPWAKTQNHRIIGSFGLEGTPRGHLVQPPRSEQGHH